MYQSIGYVKLKSVVQSTQANPTIFIQNTITYSVRSHESQFPLNVCAWIEVGSSNGRKRVAWDDVTKRFLFYKAAILTNSLNSFKHWNVKYINKVK